MNTPLSRLQHDLDLLDSLFIRWDARESVGTEIAHAIGVGSGYRFVRELMAAYRGSEAKLAILGSAEDFVDQDVADARSMSAEALEEALAYLPSLEQTLRMCQADLGHNPGMISIPVERMRAVLDLALSAVPPSQGTGNKIIAGLEQALAGEFTVRSYSVPLAQPHPDVSGLTLVPQSALDWLFGLGDDFERGPGQKGAFWWRTEFRRRIAAFQSRQEDKTLCASDDPEERCLRCDCWKFTRETCS